MSYFRLSKCGNVKNVKISKLPILKELFKCGQFPIFTPDSDRDPLQHISTFNCGQGWIRTTELRRGQIYSLLPLATWLLAPEQKIIATANINGTGFRTKEPKTGVEPATY